MARLGAKIKAFWRSLWIQASWSFSGMQTVGFAHALEPLLTGTEGEKREKLVQHLELFNTHPFLATAAIGAVAKTEAETPRPNPEAAEVRKLMMGPMGGMGDTFFWGGLKVFAATLGVLMAVEGWTYAPLALVGLFLAANLTTRWRSLELGLTHGKMALLEIQKRKPVLRATQLKLATAAVLGWTVARHATAGAEKIGIGSLEAFGFAAVVVLATAWATKRGTDPLIIIYAALIAAIMVGFMQ